MVKLREFSACVTSNGIELPEYLTAIDPSGSRTSCWIPSQAGESFSVHWTDHGSKMHTCTFITLDGFVIPGRFLFGEGSASREGIRTGSHSERPFVFAENRKIVAGNDLGTIVVKIRRVRLSGAKRANSLQNIPDEFGARGPLGGHCVRFGGERSASEQSPTTWRVESLSPSEPHNYVTFVFRYRSRDFLSSQGIISSEAENQATRCASSTRLRVVSAPSSVGPLATPSSIPSPGPASTERNVSDRVSSSLKPALYPGVARQKPQKQRSVSTKELERSSDRFPGQGILEFDFPLPLGTDADSGSAGLMVTDMSSTATSTPDKNDANSSE